MENDKPKGETPGQPAPADKKRELPFVPLYQGHRKTLRAPRPGELDAFPNPTGFIEHVQPAPERPFTPMTPWRFAKALPVRGEPRPDLAPPSPLPPIRSRSRKPQRKTEQTATPQKHATEPQTAPAGEQPAAGTSEQTVFDRIAELEARVAELEIKEIVRREQVNEYNRQWREKHLEKARQQTRARMRAYRARKRQGET